VPSAADDVHAAIAANGPLRFDRFMELALYGEHGFYRAGGAAGRRGDFITSAEVGPLFGAVLARFVEAERARLGAPDAFTVVEAGAGRGTLARALLAAVPGVAYVAVEIAPEQRALHPNGVESRATLPDPPLTGVIVANELLDNLPFRLLVFDGAWREAHVQVASGRLVEVLLPPTDLPSGLPDRAPLGARVPWQQAAAAWVDGARSRLVGGCVVAFDYVTASTAELAVQPWRQWLRTYREHQRGDHYLAGPGTQDITAQVARDQLPPPTRVELQADFLRRWGIDELIDEGRRAWAAAAARPDLAAMAMRSRISEGRALTDPSGLGGFQVLTWRVDGAGGPRPVPA
jgi:SAM-dependent MidA family methyltransferase